MTMLVREEVVNEIENYPSDRAWFALFRQTT